jgi:hypothetical protein
VLDRWVSLFRTVHRYHCSNLACEWEGLVGSEGSLGTGHGTVGWRVRLFWFMTGSVVALAVAGATHLYLRKQTEADQMRDRQIHGAEAVSRSMLPGEDFAGVPLPPHDERVIRNATPLSIRYSCAWGTPGGNPYRGTVEQALSAARLPAEVVTRISEMAARGRPTTQVEISRSGIRSQDGLRDFGRDFRSMAFGNTLCVNTHVNFKMGHVEYASLYEVYDNTGQRHTVAIPHVCQNVAVLGERAETPDEGESIPEPASWMTVLAGLAALGVVRARVAKKSL